MTMMCLTDGNRWMESICSPGILTVLYIDLKQWWLSIKLDFIFLLYTITIVEGCETWFASNSPIRLYCIERLDVSLSDTIGHKSFKNISPIWNIIYENGSENHELHDGSIHFN